MVFGVWPNVESFQITDALVIALIAILIVFVVLTVIILVTTGVQKGMEAVEAKTKILPKKENKILDEDSDAVIAALVAVIDFHKETGKDAEIISIKKVED